MEDNDGMSGYEMFDLSNKAAVVTGAGRGIGKAAAVGLARAGADVGLVARTETELEAVAEQIRSLGRRAVLSQQVLDSFLLDHDTLTWQLP